MATPADTSNPETATPAPGPAPAAPASAPAAAPAAPAASTNPVAPTDKLTPDGSVSNSEQLFKFLRKSPIEESIKKKLEKIHEILIAPPDGTPPPPPPPPPPEPEVIPTLNAVYSEPPMIPVNVTIFTSGLSFPKPEVYPLPERAADSPAAPTSPAPILGGAEQKSLYLAGPKPQPQSLYQNATDLKKHHLLLIATITSSMAEKTFESARTLIINVVYFDDYCKQIGVRTSVSPQAVADSLYRGLSDNIQTYFNAWANETYEVAQYMLKKKS